MGTIKVDTVTGLADPNKVSLSSGATLQVDEIVNVSGDNDSGIDLSTNDNIKFDIAGSQKAMFDSSGNLLVAKTSSSGSSSGIELRATGRVFGTSDGATPLFLNRLSDEGSIATLRKDGSEIGTLGVSSNKFQVNSTSGSNLLLATDGTNRVAIDSARLYPNTDDSYDLGLSSIRFDDIFATNGTIQTSDKNEKNTITDSDLGLDFVSRLSPKSYKFNNKTRTHYGLIAQDIETVLGDVKKDASQFAGFCKDDISEKQDGSEYRYGLRYHEFISPMIQAIKDLKEEVDTLKAKVTALESK